MDTKSQAPHCFDPRFCNLGMIGALVSGGLARNLGLGNEDTGSINADIHSSVQLSVTAPHLLNCRCHCYRHALAVSPGSAIVTSQNLRREMKN